MSTMLQNDDADLPMRMQRAKFYVKIFPDDYRTAIRLKRLLVLSGRWWRLIRGDTEIDSTPASTLTSWTAPRVAINKGGAALALRAHHQHCCLTSVAPARNHLKKPQ